VPDQAPVVLISVRPTVVVPGIAGGESFDGLVAGAVDDATTPVAAELAGVLTPPAVLAVSVTTIA
jgi:hypothetical protein